MTDQVDSRRSWVVMVAATVTNAIGFGTAYTFSTFFKPMAAEFEAGQGRTALVFSITVFLLFGLGVISGPLSDRFGPRRLVIFGAVCVVAGLLATSRVHHLWLGYLTYGFGVGVGTGSFITPVIASVGGWFHRRRALAVGITTTGSGIGTSVLVPLINRMIQSHGWRTSYVILAAIAGVTLGLASIFLRRPPIPPPPPARERLAAVGSTRPFKVMAITGALMSLSLFASFTFVVKWATDAGVPSSRAALLMPIITASSVGGRLVLTALTARLGPVRMFQACLAAQPAAYAIWLAAGGNYPLLVLFAVVLGLSYGGFVALSAEVAAHLFGVVGLGAVLGALYCFSGLGGFIGPTGAGFVADATDGRVAPILLTISVVIVATGFSLFIPTERQVAAAAPEPAAAG
ncbi:MAG: MFS transporter [Acidimicrobiales bacterium]